MSERNWNMWIPGFGSDDLKPYKKAPVTDAHKQVNSTSVKICLKESQLQIITLANGAHKKELEEKLLAYVRVSSGCFFLFSLLANFSL